MSSAIGNLVRLRSVAYDRYREGLGKYADHLPEQFSAVVAQVIEFADILGIDSSEATVWNPVVRRWETEQSVATLRPRV
jgi:hypothetical protein